MRFVVRPTRGPVSRLGGHYDQFLPLFFLLLILEYLPQIAGAFLSILKKKKTYLFFSPSVGTFPFPFHISPIILPSQLAPKSRPRRKISYLCLVFRRFDVPGGVFLSLLLARAKFEHTTQIAAARGCSSTKEMIFRMDEAKLFLER